MTYELEPKIIRIIPFHSEGGALAAVDVAFGPIVVSTKLYKNSNGYFLSLPSRKSESQDKWYDQVSIADVGLKMQAQARAVREYDKMKDGQLVAV